MIIGGGFAGLECARRLANDDRFEITLIEGSEHILEAYNTDQCLYARERLEKLGVEVHDNTRVTNVRDGALDFKDGTTLEAAGIIGNPPTAYAPGKPPLA